MKRWLWIFAAGLVAIAAFLYAKIDGLAQVAAGYFSKVSCSEMFVAGRSASEVIPGDFENISPGIDLLAHEIDAKNRSVTASLYGLGRSTATYREGYGCTLARGGAPDDLPTLATVVDKPLADARRGSAGERDDVDYAAIDAALGAAFADGKAATRAILVVRDGAILAERYAEGFGPDTPLLSWSMAKSVTATMIGAAVMRGFIDLGDPAPVAEWENDAERAAITWDDLMRMQSGLAFEEDYGDPSSDVSQMLFRARDAGAVAAARPLAHAPGSFWSYSSGTTNLIQRTLRATLEANDVGYHDFARETLFAPLGAASFVLEPDAAGGYIGSSFMYATARDWAKLGLLYLNDGVAHGERLLPEGWSKYVSRPASASDGQYGAQFWLNQPGADGREKFIPGVPDEAYLMSGHEGQYVLIIPDKRLVIVRAGLTRSAEPMPVVAPTFAAIYAAVSR